MNNNDIHPIQRGILTKLMKSGEPQNYGKLLPQSMKFESDKFNYHLQFLVKEGLVEKLESGYKLTVPGMKVISIFNIQGEPEQRMKVSVAVVAFRTHEGKREVLLQKRLRHPFYGDTNTIAGKIRLGEPTIDAAKRKLEEETGLIGDFTFVGVLRKCRLNGDHEILEDTLYHYCVTENPSGELIPLNDFGENFWVSIEDAPAMMEKNFDDGPEDRKIVARLLKGDYSWFYVEQKRVVEGYTKG